MRVCSSRGAPHSCPGPYCPRCYAGLAEEAPPRAAPVEQPKSPALEEGAGPSTVSDPELSRLSAAFAAGLSLLSAARGRGSGRLPGAAAPSTAPSSASRGSCSSAGTAGRPLFVHADGSPFGPPERAPPGPPPPVEVAPPEPAFYVRTSAESFYVVSGSTGKRRTPDVCPAGIYKGSQAVADNFKPGCGWSKGSAQGAIVRKDFFEDALELWRQDHRACAQVVVRY